MQALMGGKGFDIKSISIRLYVDVKPLRPSHLIVNEQTESFLQYLLSFNKIRLRSASELSLVSRPNRQN